MRPLLSASLALLTLPGCACGACSAQTGMEFGGTALDREDYFEECGPMYGPMGAST